MTYGFNLPEDISPALRAKVNMLLKEMQQRNRDLLLLHVELVEKYKELFHEVAAQAPDHMILTREEVRDLVKCGAVSFVCHDLEHGAEKFDDIMQFPTSWEEKLELIRLSMREAPRTKQ